MERQFFNQSQPQTMQFAVLLLYANLVFALLFRTGSEGLFAATAYGLTRTRLHGSSATFAGNVVALVVIVGSGLAAYLIANEKKVGWRLGVVIAAVPILAVLILVTISSPRASVIDVFNAFGIRLLFDVALLALLLHNQTKAYEKVWFK